MNDSGAASYRGAAPRPPALASRSSGANPHTIDRLPAPLAVVGITLWVGGTQGGYFPTSWSSSLLLVLALLAGWLIVDARTDAGRRDVAFAGALAGLTAWVALSALWSDAFSLTVDEIQRAFLILAAVSTILLVARRGAQIDVAFSIAVATATLAAYGLATRLIPESIGTYAPISGYRLSEPIGYWNGLGLLSVVGLVLALGVAAEPAAARWMRISAAGASVVLAPTLFYTYSRGAWVALGIGLAASLGLSKHRLATLGALCVLAPAPALAVLMSSRATALTRQVDAVEAATRDGRRLLVVLVLLTALAAAAVLALIVLERRVDISPRGRIFVGAITIAVVGAACVVLVARLGDPVDAASRVVREFRAPPKPDGTDLNSRLFTLSGSGRAELWEVAWHAYRNEPVLGGGAGTFERSWQASTEASFKARDAHSLYLETLAELGPVGLALLLVALSVPVAAFVAARATPVVPTAFGAYVAFAVHAAIDWDWELPVITVTALFAGCVGIIAARDTRRRRLSVPGRFAAGAATLAVAAVAIALFVGHAAIDRAASELGRGNAAAALDQARRARTWAPWSPSSPTLMGEAFLALGNDAAARTAFDEAIELDPGYWRAWLGRAVASDGRSRTEALLRARTLYKNSRAIIETVELLERAERAER